MSEPTGVELIALERTRQVECEGYTVEHDDEHVNGEMVYSAVAYALHASGNPSVEGYWPFGSCEWKPSDNPVRNLTKAGALIAAEIDRLQRRG